MNIFKKVVLASALTITMGSAQAVLIDDFNTGLVPFPGLNVTGPGDTDSGAQTGTMIGGNRNIDVLSLGGEGTSIVTVTGVLDINNGVTERSLVTASWAFASTDFTDGGLSTGIFLSLPSPIDNIMDVVFNLSDGVNTSVFTTAFPDGASGNDFFLAFSGFVGSADITALTSASIEISSPNNGLDTQIDLIETRPVPLNEVPEPGVAFLLGVGLVGFGARVIRSKK